MMGFIWKGDRLFVKTAATTPTGDEEKWTSFQMDLRQEIVIPDPNE